MYKLLEETRILKKKIDVSDKNIRHVTEIFNDNIVENYNQIRKEFYSLIFSFVKISYNDRY